MLQPFCSLRKSRETSCNSLLPLGIPVSHLGYKVEHFYKLPLKYIEIEFRISPLCPWEAEGKICCWKDTQ